MISSVDLSILLLLTQAPGGVSADSLGVNPLFEGKVVEQIAARWDARPERVRVVWLPDSHPEEIRADAPFRIVGTGTDGWLTLRVEGDGPSGKAHRIRAGAIDTLFAAARPVAAGTILRRSDLRAEERFCWGPPANPERPRPGPGWEARANLAEGETIAWPSAVAPSLVEAGAPIRLEWEQGAVRVSLEGTALNAARLGDIVRVRIPGRPERLLGTVAAAGIAVLTDGGAR